MNLNERLAALRQLLYDPPGATLWLRLYRTIEAWVGQPGFDLALDYTRDHVAAHRERWVSRDPLAPCTWLRDKLKGRDTHGALVLGACGEVEWEAVLIDPNVLGAREGDPALPPVPYALHVKPVTQEVWVALMDSNPSTHLGNTRPVESINWFSAVAFCNAMSRRRGLPEQYSLRGATQKPGERGFSARVEAEPQDHPGFRLPTPQEWEFACWAHQPWEEIEPRLEDLAWFGQRANGASGPVAALSPNDWGLFDMLGNVCEWTSELSTNAPPPNTQDGIFCGSSYGFARNLVSPAFRGNYNTSGTSPALGLRLARTIPEPAGAGPVVKG